MLARSFALIQLHLKNMNIIDFRRASNTPLPLPKKQLKMFKCAKDTAIYIENIEEFSKNGKHIKLLDKMLVLLTQNGFTVNLLKCQ